MTELTDNAFYMVWFACGVCMFISYFIGKSSGYKQLHSDIASTLLDIELERTRIAIMRSEITKVQDELTQTIEDNE
jgi:hypothetical protein